MVENAKIFLEEIKPDVSQDDDKENDKEDDQSASDTSSTHDSTEDHSITPPGAYTVGGGWQDFEVAAGNFGQNDNKSPGTSTTASSIIASSPFSATFKTFDDMSILTDDNTLNDFEISSFHTLQVN